MYDVKWPVSRAAIAVFIYWLYLFFCLRCYKLTRQSRGHSGVHPMYLYLYVCAFVVCMLYIHIVFARSGECRAVLLWGILRIGIPKTTAATGLYRRLLYKRTLFVLKCVVRRRRNVILYVQCTYIIHQVEYTYTSRSRESGENVYILFILYNLRINYV